VPGRVAALIEERRRLERELAEAKKALALGGGKAAEAQGPEQVGGTASSARCSKGWTPRAARPRRRSQAARRLRRRRLVAVNDGRASVAVGVTDDLTARFSAVDLVKRAVAALGGQGGGGRPDMAQGGGPDGEQGAEALDAVRGCAPEQEEPVPAWAA
jgi:alanyl-tRNA synthetase